MQTLMITNSVSTDIHSFICIVIIASMNCIGSRSAAIYVMTSVRTIIIIISFEIILIYLV